MFSRRKETEKKPRTDLPRYDLFDMPNDHEVDATDSDLEEELAAITAGSGSPERPKRKPRLVPEANLDAMVAASLKDIGSDDELSGDDDDPALLSELSELTGTEVVDEEPRTEPEIIAPTSDVNVTDLQARLEMYRNAEANAKATGDTSKVRRFGRGIKTIEGLLKQAKAGKPIDKDEIPPEVSVKPITAENVNDITPSRPAPPPPIRSTPTEPAIIVPTTVAEPVVEKNVAEIKILLARQQEYKTAALNYKKSGDMESAKKLVKIVKMFDVVIKSAQNGDEVDLSDMPPKPEDFLKMDAAQSIAADTPPAPEPQKEEAEAQNSSEPVDEPTLVQPTSVLEALEQRLAKYKSVEQAAKDEENSSKARRFGRIVKQYEDAIKRYKAGKTIDYEELPTPPGFGPIPVPGGSTGPSAQPSTQPTIPTSPPKSLPDDTNRKATPPDVPARKPLKKQDSRIGGNHSTTSVNSKQIEILLSRQKEFKDAAIEAKRGGEIEQAKEYLKIYKGFDSVLDAAHGGLPVDLSTLPVPPSQRDKLEDSFTLIDADIDTSTDDLTDISVRLEEQLTKQLMMCKNTRDHHRAMGDVAGTNRFENLALSIQKDLDTVRYAKRNGQPIPKFHYEMKSFNIVKCNTELADTQMEIGVMRGIGYSVSNPKDIDTYVKVEFPYPQEAPIRFKTQCIQNTDSPEYNERVMVEIQPKQRQCQRVFKRHGVKFEVYSKGGWLRSDTLIGTATVKLQQLEAACEIHDSYDLMDGRKAVGGKLEVRIRIRNPIHTKQIEHIQEKWVVIGS